MSKKEIMNKRLERLATLGHLAGDCKMVSELLDYKIRSEQAVTSMGLQDDGTVEKRHFIFLQYDRAELPREISERCFGEERVPTKEYLFADTYRFEKFTLTIMKQELDLAMCGDIISQTLVKYKEEFGYEADAILVDSNYISQLVLDRSELGNTLYVNCTNIPFRDGLDIALSFDYSEIRGYEEFDQSLDRLEEIMKKFLEDVDEISPEYLYHKMIQEDK